MKTLHISIIFVSLLLIIMINTNLPAAQGISGSAYFMKSNSTAKIYADFTISILDNQRWDVKSEIVTSLDDFGTKPTGLTIDAQPSSFIKNMHHVHVTYTITAKDNTKGVYPLFLFFCGTSPLVVGLNESEVNPTIYNKFFTAVYTCPAISGGIPDMNIVGYSRIISKILSIDSNNTVRIVHVDTLGFPLQTPLKQFKTGTLAKDVRCRIDLQLIIKTEDGSPACVTQDTANILAKRGWAKEIISNTSTESSPLNKTTTNELEIELSNQTYEAGYPVYVNLKNVNLESTCKTPSISVRNTSDQSLVFGPTPTRNDTGYCADPSRITFYAGLEKNALITKPTKYSVIATLDNKTYQKEFTAIPSQYSNKNITADSTQIMPGYLTFTSCLPVSDVPNNGTIINYTGFDLYHRYLAGPDTGGITEIDDYLLKPGNTGSFVMQVHQGQFSKDANLAGGLYFLSENLLNLDNSTVWNNRPLASEAHSGLVLSYTPSFAKAGPQGYATITASITALHNAPRGTYWLHLPPGICGGNLVLLTIGEQPLAQPPDYIGSDLASNFAQGVGNPTQSDVTFELINAGIHTFENCSLNYVTKNQTTTIKTFDVIPPGMEYKYHANLTSISKVSGFLECKKPSMTKVYPDMWIDIIPY